MTIRKAFIKSPSDVIHIAISLMQRWSLLLKEEDKLSVSQILEAILGWMKCFKPKTTAATDVFEI